MEAITVLAADASEQVAAARFTYEVFATAEVSPKDAACRSEPAAVETASTAISEQEVIANLSVTASEVVSEQSDANQV